MKGFLVRHAPKLAVSIVAGALYLAASPHHLATEAAEVLAAQLAFRSTYIEPADVGRPMKTIRKVNPSLVGIDAWISSVGAGIALADIDGSGLPDDICLVDPRNDTVTIMPAPETGDRYRAFALEHEGVVGSGAVAPMGCQPIDANEDGQMDVLIYYWGRTPLLFLRNPDAGLEPTGFRTVEIAGTGEIWNTNAAIAADVDGDGHPDLVFGNYFRDGDRVVDPGSDRPVAMQHSMSRARNAGRNRLFLWSSATETSVVYRDASSAFTDEMADGWTLALAARDLDDASLTPSEQQQYGGLPEIYVANDFGNDRLLLNRSTPGKPHFEIVEGSRHLTTPRSKVLGRDSFKGMGVDFGDVVGDGRPALAVSNISSPYALLESHFLFLNNGDDSAWLKGIAPYTDASSRFGIWTSGWAWDIKFADLLNTGQPAILQAIGFVKGFSNSWPELQELAMGNDELLQFPSAWPHFSAGHELSGRDHDRLFLPGAEGNYTDVWELLGLDSETVSRGIATGDVYGDGRLSIAIARQWSPSLFLRNISDHAGRAIVIDLRVPGAMPGTTRAAIGAEARVVLPSGRIVTTVVDGGSGHAGKRSPEIHLGLGDVASDARFDIEIRWRDAGGVHRQTMKLAPGRHHVVLSGHQSAFLPSELTAQQVRAEDGS